MKAGAKVDLCLLAGSSFLKLIPVITLKNYKFKSKTSYHKVFEKSNLGLSDEQYKPLLLHVYYSCDCLREVENYHHHWLSAIMWKCIQNFAIAYERLSLPLTFHHINSKCVKNAERGGEIITNFDFPPYWQNVQYAATTCEGIARNKSFVFSKGKECCWKPLKLNFIVVVIKTCLNWSLENIVSRNWYLFSFQPNFSEFDLLVIHTLKTGWKLQNSTSSYLRT